MTRRILIAEDDSNILISLEFLLGNAGHLVSIAHDGEQAWHALGAQSFDLVVLDVMLPSVNGLELCQRIRTAEHLKTTKILILSARGRDSEIAAGLKLGADAYMTKPFGTKAFLQSVAHLLAE